MLLVIATANVRQRMTLAATDLQGGIGAEGDFHQRFSLGV